MATTSNLRCPSCSGPLRPVVLACGPCGLRVEGTFTPNEFAELGSDELHLLRIFVHCEGRIRDMESALGLSYPTIKARLADLRKRLSLEPKPATPAPQTPPIAAEEAPAPADSSVSATLKLLEEGKITYQEAMARIQRA